jgi:hypothetical protein
MGGSDLEPPPQQDDQRESARTLVIVVATIAWAVTTFLPIINPRVPSVPEIGPAFIAFLGAVIAVPEITKRRRGGDR